MFRLILEAEMDKQNLTVTGLSSELDLAQGTITRLLKNHREIDPVCVLKVVRRVIPKQETKIMTEYFKELVRPTNVKVAIEYCSTRRLMGDMRLLIDKALQLKNNELSDIAEIYNILFRYQNSEISASSLYNIIRKESSRFIETQVLIRFIEIYSLYNQNQFNFMLLSLADLEKDISQLHDEFLRNSYGARLNEILHCTYLKVLNDTAKSRDYAKSVVKAKIGHMYSALAIHNLGISYFYDNPTKAIELLEKSKQIYVKHNEQGSVEIVESTIEFIKVLNGIEIDYFTDSENRAYHFIKNSEIKKGLSILDELDATNPNNDPFRIFIKAEATKNIELYWESLKIFIQRSDKFYANMVKNRLISLNQPEFIINALFEQ